MTRSETGAALEIEELVIRFGGLTAVAGLTLRAPVGSITGLIGPNGAGKSTTFNACSGLVAPASGRIAFDGHDLIPLPPNRRAHLGIGRTFQRMELCDSLTVAENVALGLEARFAGSNPVSLVLSRAAERVAVRNAVDDALGFCELEDIADARAGALSTGQRRLVELARCTAGNFSMMLLDEPSSGLDAHESESFERLLRRLVEERGAGILIVEHDMSLIAEVCDHVYVLDFGRLIFDGDADTVLNSPVVRAAYLGSEDPVLEGAPA